MAKAESPIDVAILGQHPAAFLAGVLLRHKNTSSRVVLCTVPGYEEIDRLVVINPAFFSLHPLLEPLKKKLDLIPVFGLQFLSDSADVQSEHRGKSAVGFVASFKAVRAAVQAIAVDEGVEVIHPKQLAIRHIDENGIEFSAGSKSLHAMAMIVSDDLPETQKKVLGVPETWEPGVLHRYTYLKLAGEKWSTLPDKPAMPMSLNLKDTLGWAWMLPGPKGVQLAVEQPIETITKHRPADLLAHWAEVLRRAKLLNEKGNLPLDSAESIDLPLAGALAHEGVASRTLLVGPAGGFYSACSEDIYPNCWSTLFAVDALKKAMKERHLQDALSPYRHKWRTTLGDYLRGPQQNLRYLLPLVYRNQVMTTRLTESILLGKSVVR